MKICENLWANQEKITFFNKICNLFKIISCVVNRSRIKRDIRTLFNVRTELKSYKKTYGKWDFEFPFIYFFYILFPNFMYKLDCSLSYKANCDFE